MKNRSSKKSKQHHKKTRGAGSGSAGKKFFKKSPPKVTSKPIFPSISRFIPEFRNIGAENRKPDKVHASGVMRIVWNKYFLVSFASVFISVAIVLQGVELVKHFNELRTIRNERQQIMGEIAYWSDVVEKHNDYRDGYFKLALLEYRLGNREKAREYIDKTLFIDPNYKDARAFQQRVEGK